GSAGAPGEQQPASPPPPAAPAPSPQTWPERPTEAPQPESVAQTGTANPEAGKASTWESAPADPEPSDKDEGTSGEQRQG
ncbi:MAG: hypothetical protein L0H41_11255, partial [Microlunatus sp.]|nr:hypothetical protein [Microlunatus sp.]